jgi:hypothetical protein
MKTYKNYLKNKALRREQEKAGFTKIKIKDGSVVERTSTKAVKDA